FGQVDIVAVAPGRIIASDRTKVIQPLEASVVRKVLVKDGDRVQMGQVLVELDPTMASADKANVQEQLRTQASEVMRTGALLQSLSNVKLLTPVLRGLEADLIKDPATQAQLQSEWQDISAKLGKLDAEAARRQAETATVRETIAKLEATVPMAQTRETDFKKLVAQGYISSHATQDKTRERVELERDLSVQRARLAEALSSAKETEQAKAAYRAETLRALSDRQAQAASKHSQLESDQTKA
ncbi:biotin/lipoyl-binding protein, partial [Rhodoferax sp. UBA5149]|uniref:biotin/lipoyl-binding protein n=1 Tax=Rhodoferax sp. UBA5149 TaxID=1947379 RepID=UPI0025D15A63